VLDRNNALPTLLNPFLDRKTKGTLQPLVPNPLVSNTLNTQTNPQNYTSSIGNNNANDNQTNNNYTRDNKSNNNHTENYTGNNNSTDNNQNRTNNNK
jgi:hypothetical protein